MLLCISIMRYIGEREVVALFSGWAFADASGEIN